MEAMERGHFGWLECHPIEIKLIKAYPNNLHSSLLDYIQRIPLPIIINYKGDLVGTL